MKDKNYLHNAFNATATDDGHGDIETYENWLERQLLARIQKLEELAAHNVTNSLTADALIKTLGEPIKENIYLIKPDKSGRWWIEHKHVGSGEPLAQWLTGKPNDL